MAIRQQLLSILQVNEMWTSSWVTWPD